MKKYLFTTYQFEELSEEAKKKAIENTRWDCMEYNMGCADLEYEATMKAFADITFCECKDWEVGYNSYYCSARDCESIFFGGEYTTFEGVVGPKYVFRYVNDRILPKLWKGKYRSGKWRQVPVSKEHPRGIAAKNYHSRILGDYESCSLTGVFCDFDIIEPILKFVKAWPKYPENFTLLDLFQQCYESLFKTWHEEYEHWADNEESIGEWLEEQKIEFTKDGDKADVPEYAQNN